MKTKSQLRTGFAAGICMLLLILDSQTALLGAKEGVMLCIQTVIPSLFPFFVISGFISNSLLGRNLPLFRPIGRLCGVPEGAESLLLLGFLGGYPVGAQTIAEANRQHQMKDDIAHRLLGFCSNAGPAFIFGMASPLFASAIVPWCLWGIHILSALIVGFVLPQKKQVSGTIGTASPLSITQALENSIRIMATVCAWIVVFRVLIAVIGRWFIWMLPGTLQVLVSGLLELSNGCLALSSIPCEGTRFVMCACMLGFGGLCVGMQTISAVRGLGTGMYFPGKILQSAISILLSGFLQVFLFAHSERLFLSPICYAAILLFCLTYTLYLRRKKSCSNLAADRV